MYSISTDKKSSSWFCSRISKFTTSAEDPHMYKVTDLAECKFPSFYSYSTYMFPTLVSNPLCKRGTYMLLSGQPCPILFNQSFTLSHIIHHQYCLPFPLLPFSCLFLPVDIRPSDVASVLSCTVQLFSLSMPSVWPNQTSSRYTKTFVEDVINTHDERD